MHKEFYKDLGIRIKYFRKLRGITQQELAERMDMSLNFIGKIEVAFCKPSLDTLIKLATVLNTNVSDITRFYKD
ncbi:MAG: helix-turn-helix transcriptional regulator [Candidatus Gastranaerophilales bacterium]